MSTDPEEAQYAQAAGDTGLVTTALRRAADLGLYYGNYNYADPIGTPLYERADQQYADDATAFLRTLGYGGAYDVNANIFLQANNKGDAFTAWLKQYAATRWGLEEGGIVGAYESGGIIGNGLWGRDSVLARFAGGGTVMLAGGEGVLTAGATAAIGADAVAYINRTHALPAIDVAPPSPTIAFRRPDLGGGSGADVAALLAAIEGLRADLRAAGREALTQRARIGADAAELLARVEAATTDLPRKLANTRRAA